MDMQLSKEMLEQLAQLSDLPAPSEPSQKELDAFAEELEALAEMLEGTDLGELAELLEKAAECLRAGDCEGAAEYLKQCQAMLCLAGECSGCSAELAAALARLRGYKLAAPIRTPGGGYGQSKGGIAHQPSIPPNAPATSLYFPRTSDTSGSLEHVRTQVRPQGEMFATTEKGAPAQATATRVPYYEVISDYSQAAEEALSREDVPPTYRTTVREYFRALQSGANR
jgi:hypothetical protein